MNVVYFVAGWRALGFGRMVRSSIEWYRPSKFNTNIVSKEQTNFTKYTKIPFFSFLDSFFFRISYFLSYGKSCLTWKYNFNICAATYARRSQLFTSISTFSHKCNINVNSFRLRRCFLYSLRRAVYCPCSEKNPSILIIRRTVF